MGGVDSDSPLEVGVLIQIYHLKEDLNGVGGIDSYSPWEVRSYWIRLFLFRFTSDSKGVDSDTIASKTYWSGWGSFRFQQEFNSIIYKPKEK